MTMAMRRWRNVLIALLLIAGAGTAAYYAYVRLSVGRSVADVLRIYGPAARARLLPHLKRAGVSYPPESLAILVFKHEGRLSVWASQGGQWHYIVAYPILAASGGAGPKLREGDYQVPEGLYRIALLNPNSSYHLSMKVDYPNAFDRRMAAREKRTRLGGDIMIHGKNVSIGCIAIGDPAIEELFTLVAETNPNRVQIIIAPNDLRAGAPILRAGEPRWIDELYPSILSALASFPLAMESDSAFDVRPSPKIRKSN